MGLYKTAYLSIGSNLGNRGLLLQKAIFEIGRKAGEIRQVSAIYETPSWGFEAEDFLNACLEIQTLLTPEKLLTTILEIEANFGRLRNNSRYLATILSPHF